MSNELVKEYSIKAGDLIPDLEIEALDKDGNAINLTGFTGVIIVASCVAGRRIVDAKAVDIYDATEGKLRYVWAQGETDKPDEYLAEVRFFRTADGKPMTVPGGGYGKIIITPRL